MHSCPVYQEQGRHCIQMFFTAMQNVHHCFTYSDNTRCLDTYYTSTAPLNTVTLICPEKPMEMIQIQQPICILKLSMACSATSLHFYLLPRYETPMLDVNVSLNMANLQMVNISAQSFCIWQHLGNNKSDIQLQHLATVPSIPIHRVYQHLLNSTMPIVPFNTDPSEDTDSLWNIFTHPGIHISALGSIIPVGIGLFCCNFFWC